MRAKISALVVMVLLIMTTTVAWAALNASLTSGPDCNGTECVWEIAVTSITNPDKQICINYTETVQADACTSITGGTVVQCACAGANCGGSGANTTWTCTAPTTGNTLYYRIGSWTAGGGGQCGAEQNLVTSACGSVSPNVIELAAFTAVANTNGSVNLAWSTASELDTAGFNVYRSPAPIASDAQQLNGGLIAAVGAQGLGSEYQYTDANVSSGVWYYFLADIDNSGLATFHGPVSAEVRVPTAVALQGIGAASGGNPLWLAGAFLFVVALSALAVVRGRRSVAQPDYAAQPDYVAPSVTTLDEDALIAQLGPARALSNRRSWEEDF